MKSRLPCPVGETTCRDFIPAYVPVGGCARPMAIARRMRRMTIRCGHGWKKSRGFPPISERLLRVWPFLARSFLHVLSGQSRCLCCVFHSALCTPHSPFRFPVPRPARLWRVPDSRPSVADCRFGSFLVPRPSVAQSPTFPSYPQRCMHMRPCRKPSNSGRNRSKRGQNRVKMGSKTRANRHAHLNLLACHPLWR
jgi:hypothetical protein